MAFDFDKHKEDLNGYIKELQDVKDKEPQLPYKVITGEQENESIDYINTSVHDEDTIRMNQNGEVIYLDKKQALELHKFIEEVYL